MEKGGKGGFGYAISLLAKIVSKRTTGHRVPVHYNSLENIKYKSWCVKWKMWDGLVCSDWLVITSPQSCLRSKGFQ